MYWADITTPETLPEGTTRLGPLVAWEKDGFDGNYPICVWHWCDHHLWAGRDHYDEHRDEYIGWTPAGAGAHDVISLDPLHLEPSVYWPDCCGMHGFIRDGQWVGV
ncbi:MAG TPA: hypothetical protein VMV41_07830 [Cellulomonadaceae bacterium]|nr:hypothetical protein [Cellulomonadaceae bacterium]